MKIYSSVKKHLSYIILLFALWLAGSASAKVNNYLGAYVNAGEWSLMPTGSESAFSFGGAGAVGFLYELQAGPTYSPTRFLFDVGLGAQGGTTSFTQAKTDEIILENQFDLDGESFDYVYQAQKRKDAYDNISLQVPLLVGVHHRRFYMLAGAKVNYSLWTQARSSANITTLGRYLDGSDMPLFKDFTNMPEYQFFTDLPVNKKEKTKFNLDVAVCLEMGGRLGLITDAVGFDVPKRKVEYRLAGFVEYGLFDIHSQGANSALETPSTYSTDPSSASYVYNTTSMVDDLKMHNIMSTTGFAKAVNNIFFGLKFTVLFQLPEPGQCVICRDGYVRMSARGSGGGVKYEE